MIANTIRAERNCNMVLYTLRQDSSQPTGRFREDSRPSGAQA